MSHPHPRKRYQRALAQLETLEPRTLLSATVTSYAIPTVAAQGGVYDSSGNLWVLNTNNAVSGNSLDEIGVVGGNHVVTKSIPLDSTVYAPIGLAAGANGVIYVDDSIGNGGIDVVDTVHGTVAQYLFGTSPVDSPIAITVTGDGAVWFVGSAITSVTTGSGGQQITDHTSVIGRFDPTTDTVSSEYTTDASFDDSTAFTLASSGDDSVWVAFNAAVDQDITQPSGFDIGTSHIVAASFSGGSVNVNQVYAINTGDPIADKNNFISSIVDGGNGTVWFTLTANNAGAAPATAPDQIVEGVASGSTLTQVAHVIPGADASTPLGLGGLTFDANGNLWFDETNGSQFGNLNSSGFDMHDNTTGGQQFGVAANPAGTQLSITTIGSDPDAGSPIIQIDVPVNTISFAFTSTNPVNVREKTPINQALATFVAPAPVTSYTATIAWGDNTTSTATVTASTSSANTYTIAVSGKSFATQGTYNGVITVKDGSTTVGTLNFTSTITDTPLDVTSVTAVPLILRAVTVVGSFTDDSGLALSTWTATINWGDNTTSTALIVRDPTDSGRYLILALHQYKTKGTYTVQLTVTTDEQLAAITNSTLTTTVTAR